MAEYTCWGEDKEDLTARVHAELAEHPPGGGAVVFRHNAGDALASVFRSRGGSGSGASGPRKILVTCSKGHENVFEIDG